MRRGRNLCMRRFFWPFWLPAVGSWNLDCSSTNVVPYVYRRAFSQFLRPIPMGVWLMSASHPSSWGWRWHRTPGPKAATLINDQDEAGGSAIKTITGRIVKSDDLLFLVSLQNEEVSALTCLHAGGCNSPQSLRGQESKDLGHSQISSRHYGTNNR